MRTTHGARLRVLRRPELNTDVLIVAGGTGEQRLIGRQIAGVGRVVPMDDAFEASFGRYIELYASTTDLGRARLARLPAPLREFLELKLPPHPNLDVDNVDEIPLDVDGYI